MNEKIRELAEQAGYSKDFLAIGLPNNMEKFAELIVKDIHAYVDSMDTAQVISNGILKRYGVNL